MSAIFTYTVNGVFTKTIDSLENIIKRVEFTVKGDESGCTFELPQSVELSDPEAASFKPFAEVTQADVIAWIETEFQNLDAVKQHIQYVLDKEVAKLNFEKVDLPWATPEPVLESTPEQI